MQLSHAYDHYKKGYRYLIERESKPWATSYQTYLQQHREWEQFMAKEEQVRKFIDEELPVMETAYSTRRAKRLLRKVEYENYTPK